MTRLEAFFYALLYAYIFLGFGYFAYRIINNLKKNRDKPEN